MLTLPPAWWCCAFVGVSDQVNKHAAKPYVHSVGCPTFEDDHMRSRIWGGCWGHKLDYSNRRKMECPCAENAILETKISFLFYFCIHKWHKKVCFSCLWDCEKSTNPHEYFSVLMMRISAVFLRSSRVQCTSKAVQGAHHKGSVGKLINVAQSLSLTNAREKLRGTDWARVWFLQTFVTIT